MIGADVNTLMKIFLVALVMAACVFCSNDKATSEVSSAGQPELTEGDSENEIVADTADRDFGSFSAAANMTDARMDFVSLVLGNGDVLAAGGRGRGALVRPPRLATAEIFEVSTGQWKSVEEMSSKREILCGVTLSDGRAMIIGGADERRENLKTTEILDASSSGWIKGPKMKKKRYKHSCVILPDGKVMVAGGADIGVLNTAEIYDPSTDEFALIGEMNEVRSLFTLTVLSDGRILAAGGASKNIQDTDAGFNLNSAEIWDPETGEWMMTSNMNEARALHTANLLEDGSVLAVGGLGTLTSAEIYDPSSNTWTPTNELSIGREGHTAHLLDNGTLIVVGGVSSVAETEIYDIESGQWSIGPSMAFGRHQHTSVKMNDGNVMVIGGQAETDDVDRREMSNQIEIYSPGE